jgi:long-chain acyl-CoA synthetase
VSNLATVLVEAADRHPQRPAVRLQETVLSYAELDELSARAAGGLRAHGVRPGDRVGVRLPYVPAFAILCFGALRAGAIVLPLYPRPRSFPERPQAGVGARLVFASPGEQPTGQTEAGGSTLVPVGPDFLDQIAFWPQHPGVVDRADDDAAVMVCTEDPAGSTHGTTLGHGTLRTQAALTARMLCDEAPLPLDGIPPLGSAPRTYGLNAVILAGACLPGGRPPHRPRTRGGTTRPTP